MAVNRYLAEKIVVNWELGTPISTLKVVWEKNTSRRGKEPRGDLLVFLGVGAILQIWVTSSYIQIWLWPRL